MPRSRTAAQDQELAGKSDGSETRDRRPPLYVLERGRVRTLVVSIKIPAGWPNVGNSCEATARQRLKVPVFG
jgi:hypothetical protein